MNTTNTIITCFALVSVGINGFSQEQLGMRLSNYSGINGTMLNPAFNVTTPLRWDINVVAAGAFIENNYIYIKDANLFSVLKNSSGLSFANSGGSDVTTNSGNGLLYDITTSTFQDFPCG